VQCIDQSHKPQSSGRTRVIAACRTAHAPPAHLGELGLELREAHLARCCSVRAPDVEHALVLDEDRLDFDPKQHLLPEAGTRASAAQAVFRITGHASGHSRLLAGLAGAGRWIQRKRVVVNGWLCSQRWEQVPAWLALQGRLPKPITLSLGHATYHTG
jgi:hypothetical protein